MLTKWLGLHSSLLVWRQVWTHPLKPCFVPAALAVNILLVNYKLRTCSSAVSKLTTLEKLSWRPNTMFNSFPLNQLTEYVFWATAKFSPPKLTIQHEKLLQNI